MFSVKRGLKADLARLCDRYRDPLRIFLEQGRIPEDLVLAALLSGRYRFVIEEIDADLAAVFTFLEAHAPMFAQGTPERVAMWELSTQLRVFDDDRR